MQNLFYYFKYDTRIQLSTEEVKRTFFLAFSGVSANKLKKFKHYVRIISAHTEFEDFESKESAHTEFADFESLSSAHTDNNLVIKITHGR